MANAAYYVVEPNGHLAPLGVAGELYIGGAVLARGYWGRAAVTAERFVPDSYGGQPGQRLYRTGDLVKWRAEGVLEFLGRLDQQVKVRGYRIELGEIEVRLREQAGVAEAVVVAREEAPGEKRLVAYYTCAEPDQRSVDAATLRAHLASKLPAYMVPAAYVRLDRFPITANGKLDRNRLPAPQRDNFAGVEEAQWLPPQTPLEEVLAGLWSELLEVEHVGRNDNFFELGGHSLLATQLVSRLRETLAVDLPLRTLFEAPTLEALAQRIDDAFQPGQSATIAELVTMVYSLPDAETQLGLEKVRANSR